MATLDLKAMSIEQLGKLLIEKRTEMISKEPIFYVEDFLDKGEIQYQIVNVYGFVFDFTNIKPKGLKELSASEREEKFNNNHTLYIEIIKELTHKHEWDNLSVDESMLNVYRQYIEPNI